MLERLVTRPERDAREKLAAFIAEARFDCAAYGADLHWDRPDWDVTAHCPKSVGKAAQRSVLYFTTHENGTAKDIEGRTPIEVSIGVQTGPLLGRDRRRKGTPLRHRDEGHATIRMWGVCRACGGGWA